MPAAKALSSPGPLRHRCGDPLGARSGRGALRLAAAFRARAVGTPGSFYGGLIGASTRLPLVARHVQLRGRPGRRTTSAAARVTSQSGRFAGPTWAQCGCLLVEGPDSRPSGTPVATPAPEGGSAG